MIPLSSLNQAYVYGTLAIIAILIVFVQLYLLYTIYNVSVGIHELLRDRNDE